MAEEEMGEKIGPENIPKEEEKRKMFFRFVVKGFGATQKGASSSSLNHEYAIESEMKNKPSLYLSTS